MTNIEDIIKMRKLINALKKSKLTICSGRNIGAGKSIHHLRYHRLANIRLANILHNSIFFSNEMSSDAIHEYCNIYNIEINFTIKTSTGSDNLLSVLKDNQNFKLGFGAVEIE